MLYSLLKYKLFNAHFRYRFCPSIDMSEEMNFHIPMMLFCHRRGGGLTECIQSISITIVSFTKPAQSGSASEIAM